MDRDSNPPAPAVSSLTLALAWLAVGLPLLWGISLTVSKAATLFR
jgi:hypothetical protein